MFDKISAFEHCNPFSEHNITWVGRPFDLLLVNQSKINIDYLAQFNDQLIVINMCSEHWNNFELSLYQQLDDLGINFLILTHDYTKHYIKPRLLFFDYWYRWSQEALQVMPATNNQKNYYIGCLNGNPRPHRIANFYKLNNKSYRDKISLSFFNVPASLCWRADDVELNQDEENFWQAVQTTLPNRQISPLVLNLPQLTDCYLHIISETTVIPNVFITEKTWKAIATGVPFVMHGNPGSIEFLKSCGVDVYDNLIDHQYYDNELDWRVRLEKLHAVIDDLVRQGVDKLYTQTFDQRKSNQINFTNNKFHSLFNEVVVAIKKYS